MDTLLRTENGQLIMSVLWGFSLALLFKSSCNYLFKSPGNIDDEIHIVDLEDRDINNNSIKRYAKFIQEPITCPLDYRFI